MGAIPANALDDGQWSQGLISAVSVQYLLDLFQFERLEKAGVGMDQGKGHIFKQTLPALGPDGGCGHQQSV